MKVHKRKVTFSQPAVLAAAFIVTIPLQLVVWPVSYGLCRAESKRLAKRGLRAGMKFGPRTPKEDAVLALGWPAFILGMVPTHRVPFKERDE